MPAGITRLFGKPGEEHNTYVAAQQRWPLGTPMEFSDGRVFRFVLNGGVALVAGNVIQSEAPGANFDELVVAAAAIGATTVTVTTGATAIAVGDFDEGYLVVEDDAGEGRMYPLTNTPAVATTTAGVMNLAPGYTIQVALTSASTVLLLKNKYKQVIVAPATGTSAVVGVAVSAIPLDEHGWVQTWGPCAVTTDGVVVIGQHVRTSDGTAGSVEPLNRDGTDENEQEIGVVMSVAADIENSVIDLHIAP